jgi:hypothetical protein
MKKQSGTLRLHPRLRRYADTSSFAVAALPRYGICGFKFGI